MSKLLEICTVCYRVSTRALATLRSLALLVDKLRSKTGGLGRFCKEAMMRYNEHAALMTPFESFVPKHHVMWHLLSWAVFLGNPRFYATGEGESLSKALKAACRHSSQLCFERSVLLGMREILSDLSMRGRRRPI